MVKVMFIPFLVNLLFPVMKVRDRSIYVAVTVRIGSLLQNGNFF